MVGDSAHLGSTPCEHWHGPSGRDYLLAVESLDRLSLDDDTVYVIAKGSNVLWAGSQADLIADPSSRARFRLAIDCADRAFRLDGAQIGPEHFEVVCDLEAAEPAGVRHAA